jgi:hypothetical protein
MRFWLLRDLAAKGIRSKSGKRRESSIPLVDMPVDDADPNARAASTMSNDANARKATKQLTKGEDKICGRDTGQR